MGRRTLRAVVAGWLCLQLCHTALAEPGLASGAAQVRHEGRSLHSRRGGQRTEQDSPVRGTLSTSTNTWVQSNQAIAVNWRVILASAAKPKPPKDNVPLYPYRIDLFFSPANVNWRQYAPLLRMNITTAPGAGSYNVVLPNLRQDLQFALIYTNLTSGEQTLLDVSDSLSSLNVRNVPSHVKVVPGSAQQARGTYSVQWVSADPRRQWVKWAKNVTALRRNPRRALGQRTTYTRQTILKACGWSRWAGAIPADANMAAVRQGWVDPGHMHKAVLTGLEPAKTYYYQVYDEANPALSSPVASFTTPPASTPASTDTLRMLVAADIGTLQDSNGWQYPQYDYWVQQGLIGSHAVVRAMTEVARNLTTRPHVQLLVGDIPYSDGYLARWDYWARESQLLHATVPTITTPGNHERDYVYYNNVTKVFINSSQWQPLVDWVLAKNGAKDGTKYGGECGVPYQLLYQMPGTNLTKQWTSYNQGPLHIVVLSSEVEFGKGGRQQQWFLQDMQTVNRTATPFVVVVFHRLMFVCDKYTSSDYVIGRQIKDAWDDVLTAQGADLVLNGHFHTYTRACNRKCTNPAADRDCCAGPLYIATGWGGLTDSAADANGFFDEDRNFTCICKKKYLDNKCEEDSYTPIVRTSGNNTWFGYLQITATRTKLTVEAQRVPWTCTDYSNINTCSLSGNTPTTFDSVTIDAKRRWT